ncbi:hypothetical protein F5Y15DRAFT_416001 [Xylariaceae sp. FL0016]|nr:hypothetical protein F5Y15DRAFT_416001 [Xylariaceae sp. FL0016]
MGITNDGLSRLAQSVPGFINEHSRKRQLLGPGQDPDLKFFDFRLYYGGEKRGDPDLQSRSDASSTPDLTSGSSEDGAPSPGSTDDSFHSKDIDAIKHVKQNDDRYTVPQRELRPKISYPSTIHLDSSPRYNPSAMLDIRGLARNDFTSSSKNNGLASNGSPRTRGKRCAPLANPAKVAEARRMGTCTRCKLRKVTCDRNEQLGGPCSVCIDEAGKIAAKSGITGWSSKNVAGAICLDRLTSLEYNYAFNNPRDRVLPRNSNSPVQSKRPSCWNILFEQSNPTSYPLTIPIVSLFRNDNGQLVEECVLDKNQHVIVDPNELLRWASQRMLSNRGNDLQAELDRLVIHYADCDPYGQPNSTLINKTRAMRCMYEIWRQEALYCQRLPNGLVEMLPGSIHQALRAIAERHMKSLQHDILDILSKPQESIWRVSSEKGPFWVCTMQLILLYRDMSEPGIPSASRPQGMVAMAKKLLGNMIAISWIYLSKRKPDPPSSYNDDPVTMLLRRAEVEYRKFYEQVPADSLLRILPIELQKPPSKCKTPASKRARK